MLKGKEAGRISLLPCFYAPDTLVKICGEGGETIKKLR